MNCLANLTLRWRSLKTAQHTYQHNRRRIKSIFFNGADFLEDLFFRYANISIAGSPGRLAYFVYQNLHFSFFSWAKLVKCSATCTSSVFSRSSERIKIWFSKDILYHCDQTVFSESSATTASSLFPFSFKHCFKKLLIYQ